jgi:hypothetical protein
VAAGLRAALPGVVVLDLDHFLDAGSRLAGVDLREDSAADRWPAYNDPCLTLLSTVLAAGHDVLVLSPADAGRGTPVDRGAGAGRGPLGGARLLGRDPHRQTAQPLHRLRPRRSPTPPNSAGWGSPPSATTTSASARPPN